MGHVEVRDPGNSAKRRRRSPCPKGVGGSRRHPQSALCPPLPGISLIMWNALYTAEKVIIRWTLLTEACYFGVQFLGEH